MSSMPYMKFYISDYVVDTQHLTTIEHGAYMLLIMTYFQTGKSLPDNDRKLSKFCKLSEAKFKKVKSTLKDFFFISDGEWVHKRVEKELDEIAKKSGKARFSAMLRWSKSIEISDETDDANAMRTQCERNANAMLTEQNRTKQNRYSLSGKPDITPSNLEIKNQAIEVLNFLNLKTGRKFRLVPANLKLIIARLKSGASVIDCKQVIAKKRREWIGQTEMSEYLRPKTLFNATNFEQYLGEIVEIPEEK